MTLNAYLNARNANGVSLEKPLSASAWFALAALFVLALVLLTIFNGPSVINAPTDVFILLDGAARIHGGQIAHTDFSNPIGVLTYALVSIGMSIGGVNASALSWATALLLLIVGLWASWIACSRLTPGVALTLVVFLSLLCVATRPLGFAPDNHSYAMLYNRIGWVLISMVFVQAFISPEVQTPRATILDAISLGLLVGLLFFTKITFAIVAAGTVFLVFVATPSMRSVLGFSAGIAVSVIGISWATGVRVDNYLHDLAGAAAAQSLVIRLKNIAHAIVDGALPLIILSILWILLIWRRIRRDGTLSYDAIAISIQFAVICAAAILISAGNALEGAQVPAYAIAAVILVNHMYRNQKDTAPLIRNCAIGAMLILIAAIAVPDIRSIVATTMWRNYRLTGVPQEQRFNAASLQNFVIPKTSEHKTQFWRAKVMPARINDGLALLRRHVNSESRIFVAATANPFSFALGLPAPRGGPLWWDRNFSYSSEVHPPASQVFSDVNLVMIPRLKADDDGCCKEVLDDLMTIYKKYLAAEFVELDRNATWILLKRM